MPSNAEIANVSEYLVALAYNRRTGVKETSNYPAIERLFNEVGRRVQVRCIIHPKNQGAGLPDGGFFTNSQLRVTMTDEERILSQTPERGAVEVKPTSDDVLSVARSGQVAKYLGKYGQVLVTNCFDFQLVAQDPSGNTLLLERFRLAESEEVFWRAAAHPHQFAEDKGEQLLEYLQRVMLRPAPLTRAQEVAWFLASYARDAKARIDGVELEALSRVRTALEEALGMKFTGERGDHFFRSTLIQTLFYGIFSAWVLWSKSEAGRNPDARFDWRVAGWYLHVPMVSALFNQVANRQQLEPLGLMEVLDWTGETLNRIDRNRFFTTFDEGQAVQYFYEPFLEAYDPVLRAQLGVWFTPREIIDYMVERVDWALRSELGIADGLADPNVYVLDPCCGTGGYLVSVLRRIVKTLQARGEDALVANDVKRAAMNRIFGFEILPAPFVVAHLQLGLLLQQIGAPISNDRNERAAIYLTNALTGWDPADPAKERYVQASLEGMPELIVERDAASYVKQHSSILVILGNPPYNAFAGTSPEEEHGLVESYKQGLLKIWGIKKYNLDDLYIRFFRLAERRIAEQLGKGVVCYISNFSYLSDPSFVVMRERFLREFDSLWFDCLNGDSRETGKLTPEGKPDPSVFSTDFNRDGIRVGTAIGLMVRSGERASAPSVYFRQYWGVDKRAELLASLRDPNLTTRYKRVGPSRENRYSFRHSNVATQYRTWPLLRDLALEASNGLMEKRNGALIDMDKEALARRMQLYYDQNVSWETLVLLRSGFTNDAARFNANAARTKVLAAERYQESRLRRYAVRPFETRWCYYSPVRPLWNEPRPALWSQCWEGNSFVLSRTNGTVDPEGVPVYFVSGLSDDHLLMTDAMCFPVWLRNSTTVQVNDDTAQHDLFSVGAPGSREQITANLSQAARKYLEQLGIHNPDIDVESAALIWMHALAIGFSPLYISEHADGIRENWPRIPLPSSLGQLQSSAALGAQIASLLDTERQVAGITMGTPRAELARLGNLAVMGGGSVSIEAGDLEVRAGWGYAGRDGVTMPGKGKVNERPYSAEEMAAFAAGDLSPEQAASWLGGSTCDIYLNDQVYWKNIPTRVWNYRIGGYQVIKKWLSYREHTLLGRGITPEEVREVTAMVRRVAAILLLEPELDAAYLATVEDVYKWSE